MSTPEQWLKTMPSASWRDLDQFKEWIEAIQREARIDGLKRAVEIVSLRIATPKNAAYTAAIEESKVFLGAEIERGGKPAYCTCQNHQGNPVKKPLAKSQEGVR